MSFRLYIVPVVGTGTKSDPRRPKYFQSDAAGAGNVGIVSAGQAWSGMDYGFEPWMFVGADMSTSDDNLVVGKADAFACPFDLSVALTVAQVTNVQNKLEAINVPAGWVSTSLTWVQVLRVVLGMFALVQRYAATHGVNGLFTGGVALSTTIAALPAQVRQDFQASATSLGLDTSAITGTTTIRQALKLLSDQLSQHQYDFNGTLI